MRIRKLLVSRKFLVIGGFLFFFVLLEFVLRFSGFLILASQEFKNKLSSQNRRKHTVIVCLGESTTALGGDDSFPSQLEKILNAHGRDKKISIINKGRAGIKTSNIISNIKSNLNEYHPDVVIAMMGINDGDFLFREDAGSTLTIFFKSFKVYRFIKFMQLHILTRFKEVADEKNIKSAKEYSALGEWYRDLGDMSASERMFKKAEGILLKIIAADPYNSNTICQLGELYDDWEKYPLHEEMFKKAIEIDPKNVSAYYSLGDVYFWQRQYAKSQEMFEDALGRGAPDDRQAENALFCLFWIYLKNRNFSQAENHLKDFLMRRKQGLKDEMKKPKNQYLWNMCLRELETFYREEGKDVVAEELSKLTAQSYYIPETIYNYRKLKKILDSRKIKLICVQYPLWDVKPLERIFKEDQEISFVDNEKIFKDAVKNGGYTRYFTDTFAGNFGHCTREGNGLLAENIAKVVLRELDK